MLSRKRITSKIRCLRATVWAQHRLLLLKDSETFHLKIEKSSFPKSTSSSTTRVQTSTITATRSERYYRRHKLIRTAKGKYAFYTKRLNLYTIKKISIAPAVFSNFCKTINKRPTIWESNTSGRSLSIRTQSETWSRPSSSMTSFICIGLSLSKIIVEEANWREKPSSKACIRMRRRFALQTEKTGTRPWMMTDCSLSRIWAKVH